ncbi:hypothetical protein Tco_1503199 [Tanacetum coccineum]
MSKGSKHTSKEKEERCRVEGMLKKLNNQAYFYKNLLLNLKPLPKIDPKDKGKKKIEEEEESESEDDDIPQAVKKFKQLESDEELARKVQEDWEAEEAEKNRLATFPIIDWKTVCLGQKHTVDESKEEEINLNVITRSNGQQRYFSILTTVLSIFNREDLIAMFQLVMDKYQDKMPEEKKYLLKKEILVQMLKLKLESEEECTMALELIRFIKKVLADLESKEEDCEVRRD